MQCAVSSSRKGLFLSLVILAAVLNMAAMGLWASTHWLLASALIVVGYGLALLFAYLKDGEG